MITNRASLTNIHEIAAGIYRINTPVAIPNGPVFNFNQYLIADEVPLVFHTSPRKMFSLVAEAIGKILPVNSLRYIAFSHYEADECGSLNEFLAVAPNSVPVCSKVAAMVSVDDVADRPAKSLGDSETLSLGKHTLRWYDTPHLPHSWEAGLMMDLETRTLFCGDLFTQGEGARRPLPGRTYWRPARRFEVKWTIFHMVRTLKCYLNDWLGISRKFLLVCTEAPIEAMALLRSAPWHNRQEVLPTEAREG